MGEKPLSVVQISDLHLNPDDAQALRRVDEVRRKVAQLAPDLIIASGDVSAEGFLREGVLDKVQQELSRFCAPVYVIPGNHDVGNKASIPEDTVRREYVHHWNSIFKQDRFSIEHGEWMLLGLNTQIIGSGFEEEKQQLVWLDEQLARGRQRGMSLAVFMHTPAYIRDPDEAPAGKARYWSIDLEPRQQLLQRLNQPEVKLVASGHLHWHRTFQAGQQQRVWCPSVAFIVDDANFPRGGAISGVMSYQFNGTGVHHQLVPMDLSLPIIWIHRPVVDLPSQRVITIAELVCAFSGTLSRDGDLLPGLADRLAQIAQTVRVTVLTADTFGKARSALAHLPVEVKIIRTGAEKARYVRELGAERVVAIGNGRNDAAMFAAAALGIGVIGPEGASAELLREADIIVNNVNDALDLIINPTRLRASLRD